MLTILWFGPVVPNAPAGIPPPHSSLPRQHPDSSSSSTFGERSTASTTSQKRRRKAPIPAPKVPRGLFERKTKRSVPSADVQRHRAVDQTLYIQRLDYCDKNNIRSCD
ncbi:BZ3500_MvSof-1268-A1-R1_Chr2-1g04222 [Microbotryum saponariae]|uniref:BZ3500_MvSof-1268-A1-R1_Chr2-1g04222 protein n=1 Tax=Microbotryum saponariae TaxID=289078 RepID=A0A2X0KA11_9BASI|nr:BZ3500_MvSof-1268-A1-R1_Chr2-1g04222 [Microbotryum saponariae]SCZ91209.1 BZ3501_MvSof-1269-A2-R1_Chr2-1g03878 [Microbotryum saponariae]